MSTDYALSILSQVFHYIAFSCRTPQSEFGTASFIVSIDVDVGSQEIGEKNRGNNDHNVHNSLTERMVGRIEEKVVPLLLQTFDELELPATFALRGQLTEIENSIADLILESGVGHEIGAHGYSHKVFTALSRVEAEKELDMISTGMKKIGIIPRSFVFPKNEVAHLSLLEKHGYLTFRGRGDFLRDGMYIKKTGNLTDVHPSLHIGKFHDSSFSRRIVDLAVKGKNPFHIWFHPWNLGSTPRSALKGIANVLLPLFKHAKKRKDEGVLQFETMRSVVEKHERICIANQTRKDLR